MTTGPAQRSSYLTARTTSIQNPRLRLLNRLRANEVPILTFIDIPSVRQAQLVAKTGVDGVVIDAEHGLFGDESMHDAVAGIASVSASPIIRVRGTSHDILKRARHWSARFAHPTNQHGRGS